MLKKLTNFRYNPINIRKNAINEKNVFCYFYIYYLIYTFELNLYKNLIKNNHELEIFIQLS